MKVESSDGGATHVHHAVRINEETEYLQGVLKLSVCLSIDAKEIEYRFTKLVHYDNYQHCEKVGSHCTCLGYLVGLLLHILPCIVTVEVLG